MFGGSEKGRNLKAGSLGLGSGLGLFRVVDSSADRRNEYIRDMPQITSEKQVVVVGAAL